MNPADPTPELLPDPESLPEATPLVVDHVALARLYGEPLFALPQDLYIPPDALEVFFETFEGPLDLLLYLIRKANIDILDIPMAPLTRQYLSYVDEIRAQNLELAAEYLLMAAMLIEIKSRTLLPPKPVEAGKEPEDPRAELVRRLLASRLGVESVLLSESYVAEFTDVVPEHVPMLVIADADVDLISYAETPEQAWNIINSFDPTKVS